MKHIVQCSAETENCLCQRSLCTAHPPLWVSPSVRPSVTSLTLWPPDLQIYAVTPVSDISDVPQLERVPERIKSFYRINNVSRFHYDRPFHKGPKDRENEFRVGPTHRSVQVTWLTSDICISTIYMQNFSSFPSMQNALFCMCFFVVEMNRATVTCFTAVQTQLSTILIQIHILCLLVLRCWYVFYKYEHIPNQYCQNVSQTCQLIKHYSIILKKM